MIVENHLVLTWQVRDQDDQPEFLYPVLMDNSLHALLNLYDQVRQHNDYLFSFQGVHFFSSSLQISTTSYRPFRPYPPADGSTKLNDAIDSIDAFFEQEDLADIAELSQILNQCHFRALIQVLLIRSNSSRLVVFTSDFFGRFGKKLQ